MPSILINRIVSPSPDWNGGKEFTSQSAGILVVVPVVLAMAVFTTIIIVMSLLFFVMFAMFFLFHINPAISFYIVRTTSVALNVDVRRRRLVVTDAETHIGRAYLHGNRGIGLI